MKVEIGVIVMIVSPRRVRGFRGPEPVQRAALDALLPGDVRDGGAAMKPSVPNPCSICRQPIFGSFIGTGDGSMKDGGSFAHPECYWRKRAGDLLEIVKEGASLCAHEEPDEMVVAEFRQRCKAAL